MLPAIALIACLLWCGYIFLQEAKAKPDVSPALWLPTIWAMRCASKSLDIWLSGGHSLTGQERLDPLFLAVLIIAGLVALARRQVDWTELFGNNISVFLLYITMATSVLWSVAPGLTAYKLIRPFGDLLMAMLVVTERNPTAAIIALLRRCMILLIPLSIVLIRYFPELGRGHAKHWGPDPWLGVATHKNPLGQLCMLTGITLLWCYLQTKRIGGSFARLPVVPIPIDFVYAGMSIYLLNGEGHSRSATSIVCLALGSFLLLWMRRFRDRAGTLRPAFVGTIIAVGSATLVIQLLFGDSISAFIYDVLGKDRTLTGREFLWKDLINMGMVHPIGGYGYGAFWSHGVANSFSEQVDWGPGQAHNGYLETFVNLGMLGVFFLCLAIVKALLNAFNTSLSDFDYGQLRIILLVMIIALNYSEATFTVGTHLLWFVFLSVALSYRWYATEIDR